MVSQIGSRSDWRYLTGGEEFKNTKGFIPSAYRGPETGKIIITGLSKTGTVGPTNGFVGVDISEFVTKASINYTADMASELSFDVVDVDMQFSRNNAFALAQTVIYETQTIGSIDTETNEPRLVKQLFEIANVTATQSAGSSVMFSVKCYTKAVQQMKRDRKPGAIKGTGSAFIRNAAKKYGLKFFGQETSKGKGVSQSTGSKQAESLWDVMDRIAKDNKYILFEVDGYLIFASEKWLMYKWGSHYKIEKANSKADDKKEKATKLKRFVPLVFPDSSAHFQLTEYPTMSKSSNDPYEGDGSCLVERVNGTQLRPGMTAYVGDIPNMSGYFLITAVSFSEMTADPVSVTFRTPSKDPEKDKIRDLPIGERYLQTFTTSADFKVLGNTKTSSKGKDGRPLIEPYLTDPRLRPLPDANNPLRYPSMKIANLSKKWGSGVVRKKSSPSEKGPSTLETNTVLLPGNIDLWDRPVLLDPSGEEVKTIASYTVELTTSAPFKCVLLPSIYTENGEAVEKTKAEVEARYFADGGYEGSAKHLGVITGSTSANAILNARDYALMISWQNYLVVRKRFDDIVAIVSTPGGVDSEW